MTKISKKQRNEKKTARKRKKAGNVA